MSVNGPEAKAAWHDFSRATAVALPDGRRQSLPDTDPRHLPPTEQEEQDQ